MSAPGQVPGQTAAPVTATTRAAAIAANPRVAIDTGSIQGSIDLKGGRIDDISLVKFRETVDPKSPPIVLLSPSGSPEPFYAEFGWIGTAGATNKLPTADTVWTQVGAGALSVGHPVTLTYDNGEGLQFRRTISVDDKYMFTVKDEVANKTANPITLYPYALISRHGTPKTLGYYILHEGLIGVLGNDGLQEDTYKKIEEKKNVDFDVTNGWLGITDKYWAAALVPDTNAHLKAHFSTGTLGTEKTYQTDYLLDSAADRARRHRHGRRAAVRRRQGSGGHQRLREAARPQPLRPADRLGLVLLHHQADVHRHRLVLPPGRQFRPRHPHRHRADQGGVLPARQQVLRVDGEDEEGAAADGGAARALSRTTRSSSSRR